MNSFRLKAFISILFSFFLFSIFSFVHAEDSEYLNCLCKGACQADNWDCNTVACFYDPDDLTGSPSCEDASKGPCKCQGYGCGRAQINYSSDYATQCESLKESDECMKYKTQYNEIRDEYIKQNTVYNGLNEYRTRTVKLTHYSWAKLTIAFVYDNLGNPGGKVGNILADAMVKIMLDSGFPEKQSDATKLEIYNSLLKLIKSITNEMKAIDAAQDTRFKQLKKINSTIQDYNCTESDFQPVPIQEKKTTSFNDVPAETPRDVAIGYLQENEIVKGYEDGSYKPEKKINRAEFTKIIMESFSPDETFEGENCFADVSSSDWFAGYVCSAKEKGIIGGYPDGTFGPGNNINGVEMLKIIMETFAPESISEAKEGDEWWQPYWDGGQELGIIPEDMDAPTEVNRGQMAESIFGVLIADEYNGSPWDEVYVTPESEYVELDDYYLEESEYMNIDLHILVEESNDDNDNNDIDDEAIEDGENFLENTYTDVVYGYSIGYPNGWIADSDGGSLIIQPEGEDVGVALDGIDLSEYGLDTEIFEASYEAFRDEFYSIFDDVVILDEGELEYINGDLNTYNAKFFVMSFTMDGEAAKQWAILVHGHYDTIYVWSYMGKVSEYDMYYNIAEEMLMTWDIKS